MDYRQNDLGTCKHIEAVLHKLEVESPTAFQWTLQKMTHLTDAVYAGCVAGKPRLMVRLSRESMIHAPTLESVFGAEILDGICSISDRSMFEKFVKRAGEFRFSVMESTRRLLRDLKRTPLSLHGNPELPALQSPETLLAKPVKDSQIVAARHLLSFPHAVIAEPSGTGKRVSALAAIAQIRRFIPEAPVVIITDSVMMAHWKRLVQIFDPKPVYQFGEPRGRAAVPFEERFQYYVCDMNNLLRDARWIQRIKPVVLVMDEFWMLGNWTGLLGGVMKSCLAPHTFWLTSDPLEERPDMILQLAQSVVPDKLGPIWKFRQQNGHRLPSGEWQPGDSLFKLWQWLSPHVLSRPVESSIPSRRSKLRIIVPPSRNQLQAMNEEFNKLVALAGANFTWTSREVSHVLERLTLIRMGMCFPEFLGLEQTRESIKMQRLAHLVAMEIRCGRKVGIFTHWPQLVPLIRKSLGRVDSMEVTSSRGAIDFETSGVQVALVSDASLDFTISGLDVVMNLDHAWDKNILNRRKNVWDHSGLPFNVEYNFVVSNSLEECGLVVMETLPNLIAGIDEADMDPAKIDTGNLRTLIRKLAGRREERISSSQTVKVDRVSQRERKVVSRSKSAHEVQRTTSRGRTIISTSSDRNLSPSPSSQMRKGQVFAEGTSLSDFEDTVILLHLEPAQDNVDELVFTIVIEPRGRLSMGWTQEHFGHLGQLLLGSPVVVGTCSSGNFRELFDRAFPGLSADRGIVDLQGVAGTISGESIDVRNLLEATCGRRVLWNPVEVARLLGHGRYGDILELGCSELRMVWELLGYMVRENRFYCKIANERQTYVLDVADHFPPLLADYLQRYQSL